MKPSLNLTIFAFAVCLAVAATPGYGQSGRSRKAAKAAASATPAATPAAVEEDVAPPVDKGTMMPTAGVNSETEILAMQGATFSSKERIAIFTGDVRVADPRFQLACDELTVYLKKTEAAKPANGTAPSPTPTSTGAADPAAADNAMGGGIDHAVAKGHVIIVQERPATDGGAPKRSIGRGERADFDNNTGDMVLHGLPSVEQNGNTHVATSPSTVMTLRRDNSLVTKGPSRTLITQRNKDDKPGGAASPAGTAPQG